MAGTRRSSSSPISIGNCKVEIEGNGVACEPTDKSLLISVSNAAKIKISVDDSKKYTRRRSYKSLMSGFKSQDSGVGCFPLEDQSFMLLNPKDIDGCSKSLLQEVLKIYMEELPDMSYAANTGKESPFLEKCISSGKYRTLILKSNCIGEPGKVIAAVSYQIIPTDTQFAEIPLAAVSSNYQKKGIGHLIFEELKKRLQSVGILTMLCWADKESEGFWLKQGFIPIGEVDSKGKVRKLPIKANIRKALCFPGGSTLMVAHIKKDAMASVNFSLKTHAKPTIYTKTRGHIIPQRKDAPIPLNEPVTDPVCYQIETSQSDLLVKEGCSTYSQKANGVSPATVRMTCCRSSVPCANVGCNSTRDDLEVTENGCNTDDRCDYSSQKVKRRVWEASVSSLKSKRVRGGHHVDCWQDLDQDLDSANTRKTDAAFNGCSFGTSGCKTPVDVTPNDPTYMSSAGVHAEEKNAHDMKHDLVMKGNYPRIMFMNIADDAKKSCLTKIVEELGGSVACDGSSSTHVITGQARRTLNFCIALCSGAWILSPHWLKASFREGKFLAESQFILEDEDYLLKYKSELKDVVDRARSDPHSLLRGYNICVANHIQPSVDVLSAIIKSAGGSVIRRLVGIRDPSKTIFLACEEDMEDAMIAAKKGVWTFSSDWFMGCLMKQELDLEAPQFAESL